MPRNERRPVEFSVHAKDRLDLRGVEEDEARAIVRTGAWRPDGVGRFGEPKWIAHGSIRGQWIDIVFVETTMGTIEVLWVLTVTV